MTVEEIISLLLFVRMDEPGGWKDHSRGSGPIL